LLDLIGFVSGGAHQSAATVGWLRVGYTLVPFALLAGGSLFLRKVGTPPEPAGAEAVIVAMEPGGLHGAN
jgi:hypothetical protein